MNAANVNVRKSENNDETGCMILAYHGLRETVGGNGTESEISNGYMTGVCRV